ncbi:MAG TPA: sigma-70 family RNA polymerase sigma factor [Candidatus Angelobacter sp.]|nr:sigma-70 family RNA polymerase sigma factor [Candidatus Angelobacter sp.]
MDPRDLSAQELLQLCLQSGDQAAWVEFVRRFQPLIAGVVIKSIRRWTNPTPDLVDDLVQDTYLKLCANNSRALREFDFQHDHALFGFLKKVASNVVQDHFRKIRNKKRGSGKEEVELDKVQVAAPSSSFSGNAERNILIEEIRQCLETHAADPNFTRDCTIFWLYYQQGLTAEAISELPAIGLKVKGVESTLLRLTRLVKEKMNERPSRTTASGGAPGAGQPGVSGA